MRNRVVKQLLLGLAVLSCLTPLYGIGYLAAIFVAARYLHFSKTFSSLLGRFVLSFTLLAATVMIVGLGTWIIQIQMYPILVLAAFFLFIAVLVRLQPPDHSSPKLVDRSDVISIGLALVAPAIIVISFQLPNPSYAGLYQYLNKGWDNSNHLLMLTTATLENGYVYDEYKAVKEKTIAPFNAYPQAWHLSTAHLANGFGFQAFNPDKQLQQLVSYTVVLFAWYVVVVYIFSKIAWRLLASLRTKPDSSRLLTTSLFIITNLLVQLLIFWGSLNAGFINYLVCIGYILIVAAMIIERQESRPGLYYLTALAMGTAATLCWLLPLPAIALSILLGFLAPPIKSWPDLKQYIQAIPLSVYLLTVGAVLLMGMQIYIFVAYSPTGGGEQLNAGRLAGSFVFSAPLLLLLVATSFLFWLRYQSGKTLSFLTRFTAVVMPVLLLVIAVYVYQHFTLGAPSYYFGKVAGILIGVVGLFFVPAFVVSLHKLKSARLSKLGILLAGLGTAGLLVVGTGQTIAGFKGLFQRNSNVSSEAAQAVIDYMSHENPKKTRLVVLRDVRIEEDYNGNLASKVPHTPLTCAYAVVNLESSRSLALKLQNLASCADTLNKDILVVTSNETLPHVTKLQAVHGNIRIVHVP